MKKLFLILTILINSVYAEVTNEERVLFVVSDLQTHGVSELKKIYKTIENLAQKIPLNHLSQDYKKIIVLKKEEASLTQLSHKIQEFALDHSIKAIDVIIGLHGFKNKIFFFDRSYYSHEISSVILNENTQTPTQIDLVKQKLRFMYNLSCYGESLNQTFIDIGFDVSTGSIKVNANAEIEYKHVLKKWHNGESIKNAFEYPNSAQMLKIADEPLRSIGDLFNNFLKNTDSTKFFLGNTDINIGTEPL